MLHRIIRVACSSCVVLLLIIGAGCGDDSDRDQIASAKVLLANKDDRAAIVQLKSALQLNPQSGEGRFLLGHALFRSGEMAAALVELEKARELHYDNNQVVPFLAKALLATGQPKKVSEQFAKMTLTDSRSGADLKVSLAAALIIQGSTELGKAEADAALLLDPKNAGARLIKARLIAGAGAFDEALLQVETVIADEPKNEEAWNLRGELLWLGKSDGVAAAKSFREAIVIEPRYARAHSALTGLLLQLRDFDAFKKQVEDLKKVLPEHPITYFFDAQLAMGEKDFKRAREGAQRLLRSYPDNAHLLQLLGAIDFQSGELVSASSHLSKALLQVPGLTLARRLLAETYLRAGQPTKALATIQPLLAQPKPVPEVLALAGEANLQSGDIGRAEYYYNLAAKANPDDAKLRAALALTQVMKGNVDAGFAQLELLAVSDSSTYVDMVLISARLRRNDLDAALMAVDRLQTKLPGKPLPELLRGQILAQRKDLAGARLALQKALDTDPVYLPAVAALATLDLVDNRPADALKRYEAFLERNPKNYRAMLAVSDLRLRTGVRRETVRSLLDDAATSNPAESAPRLAQIEYLLAERQSSAALSAAQSAAAEFPNSPEIMDVLGRAQLTAGDRQQAISTFRKIAVSHPTLPQAQLRLADAYFIGKEYAAAAQSLRRALEISPRLLVAQRSMIQVALATHRLDDALQVAHTVQKERPNEPAGFVMESEVHMSQRAWASAISAMRAALDRDGSVAMAVRLHGLYVTAGRQSDADTFAASWLKTHPRDADFLFHLGSMAMDRKDYANAEARYREVLALLPDNAAAVNNVSWLMIKQAKPGALPLAERANSLLPDHASFLDTLAMAYASEKRWPQAIETQKKAVARAPNVPAFRLSLAKMLIESGDRVAARLELQKLALMGDKFAGQSEVTSLLKSL